MHDVISPPNPRRSDHLFRIEPPRENLAAEDALELERDVEGGDDTCLSDSSVHPHEVSEEETSVHDGHGGLEHFCTVSGGVEHFELTWFELFEQKTPRVSRAQGGARGGREGSLRVYIGVLSLLPRPQLLDSAHLPNTSISRNKLIHQLPTLSPNTCTSRIPSCAADGLTVTMA